MTHLLFIESSTNICSVCTGSHEGVLALQESGVEKTHSSLLIHFVEKTLKESGIEKSSLSGVVCSMGPGSYTGLRIGLSTAKGLAYGLNIPLIGVGTLDAIGMALAKKYRMPGYYMPVIDARRMEVYTALFDKEGNKLQKDEPLIVEGIHSVRLPEKGKLYIGGENAEKLIPALKHPDIIVDEDVKISARHLHEIGYKKFNDKDFENTAYSQPIYLK